MKTKEETFEIEGWMLPWWRISFAGSRPCDAPRQDPETSLPLQGFPKG